MTESVDWVKIYFSNLGCNYWHEQSQAYGVLDLRNKDVLVVGGDCGTTAVYAINNGARYVIMHESDGRLVNLFRTYVCHTFNICGSVSVRGAWRGEPLEYAHVLIMDCEGCERYLTAKHLESFNQWCVAVHKETGWETLALLAKYKPIVTYVTEDGNEVVFCRVPYTAQASVDKEAIKEIAKLSWKAVIDAVSKANQ